MYLIKKTKLFKDYFTKFTPKLSSLYLMNNYVFASLEKCSQSS